MIDHNRADEGKEEVRPQMIMAIVTVGGLGGKKKLSLPVDTGSLLTWISAKALESVGVPRTGRKKFRTIEGRTVVRDVGEAVLEVLGERSVNKVVFARRGEPQVLGFAAMQVLELKFDARRRSVSRSRVLATPMVR